MTYLSNKSGNPNDLGYFATPTALENAYPVGAPGYFAIVGSTNTIWVWDTGTMMWVDTGGGTGGSGYQAPLSGGLTGTNTWATAPNVIVVDGVPKQKLQTDGITANWTGTTTTVLAIAPAFDIFASA